MPELEVQKYLRSGKTLEDLQVEYGVKSMGTPSLGLITLNYSQIESDMRLAIPRECRMLYLEEGTWDVACRSFSKFFNAGEPAGKDIESQFIWDRRDLKQNPLNTVGANVFNKLDGSLISVYFWNGMWRCGTKQFADARGNVEDSGLTFAELVESVVRDAGWDSFQHFCSLLDRSYCYAFELIGPMNRVIVNYKEAKLVLLASWDRGTLEEHQSHAYNSVYETAQPLFSATSLEQVLAACGDSSACELEGFVVVDCEGRRLKVKTPKYTRAAKAIVECSSPRNRLDIILRGEVDDLLPVFPRTLKEEVTSLQNQLRDYTRRVEADFQTIRHIPDRKAFAEEAKKRPYSGLLFKLYNGNNMDTALKSLQIDTILGFLGIQTRLP